MVGIMALRSATRTPAARMRVALYNTPALLLVAPLAVARAVTLRVAAAAARAVHHGELLRHGEPRRLLDRLLLHEVGRVRYL